MFSCVLCIILYTHQEQMLRGTLIKIIYVHVLIARNNNNLKQLKMLVLITVCFSLGWISQIINQKHAWKYSSKFILFIYAPHSERIKCILINGNIRDLIYYYLVHTGCILTSDLKTTLELCFCFYLLHFYNFNIST